MMTIIKGIFATWLPEYAKHGLQLFLAEPQQIPSITRALCFSFFAQAPCTQARIDMRKGDLTIAFKAVALSDLPAAHKQVAAAVLDHFNRIDGRCDPSMETLALLLGVSRRSVVRAMNRLVREGFFRREKHGGHFHCNQYTPIWTKYREIDAAWDSRRRLHRARFDRARVSHHQGHQSHFGGDLDVTQTCPNNHSYETSLTGLPKKQGGEGKVYPEIGAMKQIAKSSQSPADRFQGKHASYKDAARGSAHRRWEMELVQRYADLKDVYALIIDEIDEALSDAATTSEMMSPGTGAALVVAELHRRGIQLGHAQ